MPVECKLLTGMIYYKFLTTNYYLTITDTVFVGLLFPVSVK